MSLLPERTIERLSKYRRVLQREEENGRKNIFSHELANLLHLTPVQVRRDLMLMGHSGTLRSGYNISKLINRIGIIIDCDNGSQKVAIVGIGHLGIALTKYIKDSDINLKLTALFDNDKEKIGKEFHGIPCYSIDELKYVIQKNNITIGILTVPPNFALRVSEMMIDAGIVGIVNYTPVSLSLKNVFLEQYDVITSLEKVAYFSKPANVSLRKE